MLPMSALPGNVPGWNVGATDSDPAAIDWKTDGRADDPSHYGFTRHADAIIAIDGHIMKTLGRRETGMKWPIDVYGPDGFPSIVDFGPGMIQESQHIVHYLRLHGYQMKLRECHGEGLYLEALYTIRAPKLQPATFYALYSQGATRVIYDYQLGYGENVALRHFRDVDLLLPLEAKSNCTEL